MDPGREEGLDTLYGEFTTTGNRKVRCAVSLTDTELIVQRLGRQRVLLSLGDCVGSRAYREDDASDRAAYLEIYFYPLKRRWTSSVLSRQRVEQCFRVSALQDPRGNLEEARKWSRSVRERSGRRQHLGAGNVVSQRGHMMLLVNPQSGKGQALTLYKNHIKRMLNEAGVSHTLVITERQNHARQLVRETDLTRLGALVIMSGDGLLFEVINGLLERSDWEEAIRTPLGILPGGSGNALAASIHHYSGASLASTEDLLLSCGFLLCKGVVSRMDLVSVHLFSGTRLFSFLSLAWGFVADVDIESEKYRHLGAARFMVGTLVRLASLRVYKGKLAYLPAAPRHQQAADVLHHSDANMLHHSDKDMLHHSDRDMLHHSDRDMLHHSDKDMLHHSDKDMLHHSDKDMLHHSHADVPMQNSFHNSCHSNNSLQARKKKSDSNKAPTGLCDSLLPPLDQPPPAHWVVVPQEDFVLVLAMYQSHLAEDLLAAPDATLGDGVIHLFYVKAGISRAALLKLFLAMEKGAHVASSCAHLVHARVRALRLEPSSPQGIITVDGEVVEYGAVQAEVHRGLARIFCG